MKRSIWIVCALLLLAGVWYFWPSKEHPAAPVKLASALKPSANQVAAASAVAPATNSLSPATNVIGRSAASTNRVLFRLTNTTKSLAELTTSPHTILLENALVDTAAGLTLSIPRQLKADGDPGAYIVQARGFVNNAFRSALAAAGARIVSYIPNNAYLVQISAAGANGLSGNPLVQAVLPYEPYYKVQSSLLGLATEQKPLPQGQVLTLGLYDNGAQATVAEIKKLGGKILATDRSPFGPIVRVVPPADWLMLAQLSGVQRVELATHRELANDLARVTMGISTDTVTNANWLGLSGSNVLVEVNDSGIDPTHPDFSKTGKAGSPGANPPTRVTGYDAISLLDVDGHGTHVAGIIAGNGGESYSVSNAPQGSVTNADFRGKAPAANLFAFGFLGANDVDPYSDELLQSIPALTNALISNNSWINANANEYDLSAASYDAAVRDALPRVTGPQPVLFVFAAGNDGSGNDDGAGGVADTILSPGTAKNVITVGALEQYRNLTNEVTGLNGTTNTVWQPQTDSSSQVASYSARGNVGIQTEGDFGRFKPDVVAPGSFVVSTRSTYWDQAAYYNPTNYSYDTSNSGNTVDTNFFNVFSLSLPINTVGLVLQVIANNQSPVPLPQLDFSFSVSSAPIDPSNAGTYDFSLTTNTVSIPPEGGAGYLQQAVAAGGLNFVISDTTNFPVSYDLVAEIITTNDNGNYLTVLSNLNETVGPWYYYESGTSMAAPAVSGALALMQDFFTNTLHRAPSPALLKAMLINGARLTGSYEFAVTNNINYEGWGLVNVPNSVPMALTNTAALSTNTPMFFVDQSPTNVLATGDSRTYNVSVPTAQARSQIMRITLAWTDPPGNPAAGLKLVNNLDLIVTNLDTGAVYYGNYFGFATTPYSIVVNSNSTPDSINNVENIWLQPPLGTNFSVTVFGRNVTVNAVTLEQTNIVQDFALVVSCGDGNNVNGISVTPATPASTSSIQPKVTYVPSYTNGIYFNQLAGANAPWLSTNNLAIDPASVFGTNASLFIGQTNQWHFYVVTNTTTFTNAAFIIFLPNTLSTPRMGVFADSPANSTRPEADLNLFVASDPDANAGLLTNLNLTVISNCVYNVNGDQSSLARGGTKFIAYSNAQPNQVYYIGVLCQDQMAAEYGFVAIFSETPFSQLNPNGSQTVNGLLLPATIPDGNNTHPGLAYVFGLALYPMDIRDVTVTNTITHDNYGDLAGALTHDSVSVVLNNHDGLPSSVVNYTTIYNDAGMVGTTNTDGPGSLLDFRRKKAIGPWFLTEQDSAPGNVGSITGFTMNIEPHRNLKNGFITVTVPPGGWFYDYVDVPVGYTNILVLATNLPPTSVPPIQLYLNYKQQPDFTNYLARADLTNGVPPGNSISYGPPLAPGTYWVGLFNPDTVSHDVLIGAFLSFDANAISRVNWNSTGPLPMVDDAVMTNSISVTNRDTIQGLSVGLRVDHPRISDLAFTLISPDGTRYLLMENRGGQSTNGCGATLLTTNKIANVSNTGSTNASTNFVAVSQLSGTLPISWDFFTVPDQMTVYDNTNGNYGPGNLLFDTTMTNGTGLINLSYTTTSGLTIIMNQFGNTNAGSDLWTFTAGGVVTNNYYLAFTEDTNLTTTPIKYAVPPLVPTNGATTNLFYQPEQDISPLIGTSAYGNWTLEILDNRIGATNNANLLSWQLAFTFANTNLPPIPPVKTEPASNISTTNAQLNALVYPGGLTNTLYFEYGTNLVGTNLVDLNLSSSLLLTSNLTSQLLYGIQVTNLTPETLYYFQAITVDSTGTTNYGGWLQFVSHVGLPFAATLPATLVTGTSAQLNGMASPYGLPSIAWFEWGTNTAYGNVTPAFDVGAGYGVVYTNALITGLITNTTYHFRLVVSNANLIAYGYDQALNEANVVGWGANFLGQVSVPAGLSNAVTIAGAYNHSLAITTNGQVVAWGENTFGQTNVPSSVSNSVAVAGADTYSLALAASGIVAAWGSDIFPGAGETNVPAGLSNVVAIAGGTYSSLALRKDGTVVVWGPNIFGLTNVPVGASNVVAIAAGSLHSLALRNDGTVWAWGDDSLGQTNVPVGLSNVVAIAAGSYHSLALKNDGTVVAWGYNNDGQTNVPAGLTNVAAIAAGGFHSLALKFDGSLVAWGDNSAGQLTPPAGVTNFVAIAAGYLNSLALTPQTITRLTNLVVNFTPGTPVTNSIVSGGVTFYQVSVPTNADFATNLLLFANGPLNVWYTTNQPPTIGGVNDALLIGGATNGAPVLRTNGIPALVPGATYYLGVQNTNSATVNYGIEVDFHLVSSPSVLPPIISSIVYTTNSLGSNGFLLTWYAPSNDLFQVQWTPSLAPATWTTFTNPPAVSYNTNYPASATNATFTFFDDGSQTGGFGPTRFYRLILLQVANSLTLPAQNNLTVSVGTPVTVTNTATDSNPGAVLTYSLVNPPAGASIDTNGIITWTNAGPAGLAARFDTLVTDNGTPPTSAANTFTVFVTPLPAITNVLVTATNVTLSWTAPTNDMFQVRWTTNLAPPIVWTLLPDNLSPATITSPTGAFSYIDTNAPVQMKFYQLILLP